MQGFLVSARSSPIQNRYKSFHDPCNVVYSVVIKMKYRHYKGGIYKIVCGARLKSDPSVTSIICKSENGLIWASPHDVSFEFVEIEGNTIQRFAPAG